ncbi:MAG: hypothetical protein GTO41_28705 [Burkholderiales bacterium]|nr:hypothetical protein [Burkholderiales bacterium]
MAFNQTITRSVSSAGGREIRKSNVYSADGLDTREISVPDSTTDLLVNFTLDISQLKSIYMVSDQNLTVETNDSAAPQETIALLADKPLMWQNDSYYACPFAGDITKLYLTNSSGSTALFNLEVVHDSTP